MEQTVKDFFAIALVLELCSPKTCVQRPIAYAQTMEQCDKIGDSYVAVLSIPKNIKGTLVCYDAKTKGKKS